VAVYEIPDFRKRGGEPQLVTVVTRDEIDKFLGSSSRNEREAHLSDLRERGRLITNSGPTLQQNVRPHRTAYVFKGPASKVPKIGKARLLGVTSW
jgi:hypothetical protein